MIPGAALFVAGPHPSWRQGKVKELKEWVATQKMKLGPRGGANGRYRRNDYVLAITRWIKENSESGRNP